MTDLLITTKFMEETKNELNKLDKKLEVHIVEHQSLTEKVDKISEKLDENDRKFAPRDEFIFWRNFLITGLFLTMFLSGITLILKTIYEK